MISPKDRERMWRDIKKVLNGEEINDLEYIAKIFYLLLLCIQLIIYIIIELKFNFIPKLFNWPLPVKLRLYNAFFF